MNILISKDFKKKFLKKLTKRRARYPPSVLNLVEKIIKDVRAGGDKSILKYMEKFDKVYLNQNDLMVRSEEIEEAYEKISKSQLHAIKKASSNIYKFHKVQKSKLEFEEQMDGILLGQIVRPIKSVGIYTPGGRNPYPSSVLMCAIPARVAGVKKIMSCTPPLEDGKVDPGILVASDLAGVNEIFRIGGAQAISAMAYGTETIPSVDKIVGPGNVYVTAAKLMVSCDVAIDLPAGPSEILIIADEKANPNYIASDMLAQAEHDPESLVILLTTSRKFVDKVISELEMQKKTLSRKKIVENSLGNNGFIVIIDDLKEATDLANEIAPEHLEIFTRNPHRLLKEVENAGAIFLGEYSPVAIGDYAAGTNHVLPTGGWARIHSGLSILDFIKTMNVVECSSKGLKKLAESTIALAELERLDGHAKSIIARRKR